MMLSPAIVTQRLDLQKLTRSQCMCNRRNANEVAKNWMRRKAPTSTILTARR